MRQQVLTLVVSVLFAYGVTLPAGAADSPESAATSKASRKVNTLNLSDGYIVIDDRKLRFTNTTAIYRANGTLGTTNDLRPGMRVIIQTSSPSLPTDNPALIAIRIQP